MINHLKWPKISVITLVGATVLFMLSGTASAANRIFDLYLRNSDPYDTITFKISSQAHNCYEGTPGIGQQVGGPVKPGGYVTIRLARVQGHGCDGEQGQFAVEPSNSGGALVYFNFDNAGSLQLTNVPNAYVGSLSGKNPQNGTYTWSTPARAAVTASKPVGSWEHVCQQFCNETFTQEIINTATNKTETSQETKTALSAMLEFGIDFPGGSAGGSVTASEERTVGKTMSRELSSSRSTGKSTTVALTLEQMEERDLFAVWQWVATSRLSTGENVVLTTTKYTCTRDAQPPTYLPGSKADIAACKKPAQVAAPTPKPQPQPQPTPTPRPQPAPQGKVPTAVKLSLQSSTLPLSRTDPAYTQQHLDLFPAIYMDVAFADGSRIGPHDYHKQFANNVVFDDTSGDPNDLIQVVYWDVDAKQPQLGKFGAQLTSTGKGVGTANLKVSFRNAPNVVSSVPVTVASGAAAAPLPNMQGTYQREPVINDWHVGQIRGNPMRWTNNAGASWGFAAQPSSVSPTEIVWPTNQENPYVGNPAGQSFIFVMQNGQVLGYKFNGDGVLYRRIGN